SLIVSNLPKNLRVLYFNQSFIGKAYKKLLNENNESGFIDLMAHELSNQYFCLTDESKPLPVLYANHIYNNKKYPSPENVKAMFKRIGFKNIFSCCNKSAKADIE